MESLFPSYFFDLSSTKWAVFFQPHAFVWEALNQMDAYFDKNHLGKIEPKIPPGAILIDPETISIGKGTIVEPGAYIQGPCVIGENCAIRHGAYIRGRLITGDGCVIGHDTEIKRSILLDGAHAAHFAYVGDSILGNNVNLGAGTIFANLRLDRKEVLLKIKEKIFATGMKKLGAIVGDGVQLGCNTTLNPGTLIGKNSWSYPNVNFGGFIPSCSVIKSNMKTVIVPSNFNNEFKKD